MSSNIRPAMAAALAPFAPKSSGLHTLLIPQNDESLADVLATDTARRLIAKGASLFLVANGPAMLSLRRPAAAVATMTVKVAS